jgi:dolichyl-diphosphooligosaccharide---protein glycosyltransferase
MLKIEILFSYRTLEYYLKDEGSKSPNENEPSSEKQQYDKVTTSVYQQQQQLAGANKEEKGINSNIKGLVVIILSMLLVLFAVHCTWVTSNAYSSPSIVLATYSESGSRQIIDDYREAYYWLRKNTDDNARIMSWWDYGYQIAGMGNKTTLVDNNTWNNSHIALVGKAMSSNETEAYKIMRALDVDYVLVIFGGLIGYSGDDINKFLWMVRIAEGEHPKDIRVSIINFFNIRSYFN